MNKKLLDQLIDLYFEYYKNNAKEIIEERDNKKNYYQSYTKEKILNMTDDELKKYIGGLWSANGRTKSQIFKNNKPEVLKQEIANLLYGSDSIENRVKRFSSQTKSLQKARITELLCSVYPNEYMICNSKTDRVFEKLGIKNDNNGNENGFNYANYLKELEYGKKIRDEISLKLGHNIDLLDSDYFYDFIYENVISKKGEPKIINSKKITNKLQKIIDNYYENFNSYRKNELIKWQAVKNFQDNWNIADKDFVGMLSKSLEKANVLLTANNYFPKGMIIEMAKKEPETVRSMFKDLFDENKDLVSRINNFVEQADDLLEKYWEKNKSHYQNKSSISVYLTFMYPDKYFIYKTTYFNKFLEAIGIKIAKEKDNGIDLYNSFEIYNKIKDYVKKQKDLVKLSRESLDSSCYQDEENNILVSDIVYYFNKNNHSLEEEMEIMEDSSNEYNYPKYAEDEFKDKVYFGLNVFNEISSLMNSKKNIIIEGPPGVGKTHCIENIIYLREHCKCDDHIKMIQFHQSYSYEDFIMGYKPTKTGFELKGGIFYEFCKSAAANEGKNYYFIIDEINRGNLSKIFGETLMLMEKDYRGKSIELPYSYSDDELESTKDNISFSIPENVYIIGLMNTADRSLATLEYALRRRFAFFDLKPAFDKEYENDSENSFNSYVKEIGKFNNKFEKLIDKVRELNNEIAKDESLGEGCKIGHSYFSNLNEETVTDSKLLEIVKYEIIPTLKEYWFDADEKNKLNKWINELTGVIND